MVQTLNWNHFFIVNQTLNQFLKKAGEPKHELNFDIYYFDVELDPKQQYLGPTKMVANLVRESSLNIKLNKKCNFFIYI